MKLTVWCETPWCPKRVEVDTDHVQPGSRHLCHECERTAPPQPSSDDRQGDFDYSGGYTE